MNKDKRVEIRIKEILNRSEDYHDVFTPFSLCDEMLEKLPELNENQEILVMFNIEFVYRIKEKNKSLENVWFLTPCDLKGKVAKSLGVNENHVIKYSYKNKSIEEDMPKFDVIVGNPPYKRGLHMKFLELSYNLSKNYVVFLQPSTWLLSEENYSQNLSIKNLVKNSVYSIDIINGNSYFENISLFVPLVIVNLRKNVHKNSLIINDRLNETKKELTDISTINRWGNYDVFLSLKDKILKKVKEKNLKNLKNCENKRNKNYNWFVCISMMRGNVDFKNKNNFLMDDFFTFLPNNYEDLGYGPRKDVPEKMLNNSRKNYYGFNTKKEAYNFINYLKTKLARFSLSLNKFNQIIGEKETEYIPWLNFDEEWDDEKLYDYFNLTQEERNFIEENIPDYYNIEE